MYIYIYIYIHIIREREIHIISCYFIADADWL